MLPESLSHDHLDGDNMMLDSNMLVVFDPVTRRLYGPGEFTVSQNGLAMQITLAADPTEQMAMQIFQDAPGAPTPRKRTRKKTKNDRLMSRAMRQANERAKKKNGEWRKGWNQ